MNGMTRPDPPTYVFEPTRRVPQGFEWFAEPDDAWTTTRPRKANGELVADRCRYGAGRGSRAHGAAADAWFFRAWGRKQSWWAYCSEHLYGRWIEDGRVFAWHTRPKPTPASPKQEEQP